jgi:hemerythrin-like metal-binding protein
MLRPEYIPDWIYETLPYLYIGSGSLSIIALKNAIAIFSGLILIFTGIAVWVMRKQYRKDNHTNGKNGHIRLVWRNIHKCGNPIIDEQHRNLFKVSNELITATFKNSPKKDIKILLYKLLNHIEDHFNSEEIILEENRYPLLNEHKMIHHSLHDKFKKIIEKFHKDEINSGDLIGFIIYDIVHQHIMKEDFKFKKHRLVL